MDSPLSRPRARHGALSTTRAALLFLAAGCLAVAPGAARADAGAEKKATELAAWLGGALTGELGPLRAAAPTTLPLQWGTEMFGPLLLKDDIVSVPLTFADGQVALPQTPGLGVELDEDKLHFYTRQP